MQLSREGARLIRQNVSDVFVSHSRRNAAEAEQLCAVLEGAGISCWIAPRDIPPGRTWPASIADAIASARLIAVLVSDAANASAEVAREVIAALDAHRPLVPIRLHDVTPAGNLGYLLAGVQWHDAFAAGGPDTTRIAQVVHALLDDSGSERAPFVRATRAAPPNNLPAVATTLVGREADLHRLDALLATHRLITLTGSGGVGKTRLALAAVANAAAHFTGGCIFVDLAPLIDEARVAEATASALRLPETAAASVEAAIVGALRNAGPALVLVLDNCEHLIAAVARFVHELVRATPATIVATSREPLRVDGEVVYRVPSLDLDAAVALFAERATAATQSFRLTDENRVTIAGIARAVDGIPFAIELAAARMRAMTPVDIATRLSARFRLLTGGNRTSLPRQQTLHAMIDWSHDLLDDAERRIFRRLALFAGGWTLDAASAVCGDTDLDEWDVADRLASLVDKSLVAHATSESDARYHLLETTRAYALERLDEARERDDVVRRHIDWFVAVAECGESEWTTRARTAWRATYIPDIENQRLALAEAIDNRRDTAAGMRLATSLRPLWDAAARPAEGVAWCERALAAAGDDGSLAVARLLLALGKLLEYGIHVQRRRSASTRAVEICHAFKDERGLIAALQDLAFACVEIGDRATADAHARTALDTARTLGEPALIINALQTRSFTVDQTLLDERRALLEEAHTIAVRVHNERDVAALSMWLAELASDAGDRQAAQERGTEAFLTLVALGERVQAAFCSANLCAYALDAGDAEAAAAALAGALSLADGNVPLITAIAGQYAAEIALLRGDAPAAARAKGFSDARLAALDVARGATEERSFRRLDAALRSAVDEAALTRLLAEGSTFDETAIFSCASPTMHRPPSDHIALRVP